MHARMKFARRVYRTASKVASTRQKYVAGMIALYALILIATIKLQTYVVTNRHGIIDETFYSSRAPVYDKEQVLLLLSEEGNDITAGDAGGGERMANKTVHKEFTDIPFQFQLRRTDMIDVETPFVFFHNRKGGGSTLREAIFTAATQRYNLEEDKLWIPCHGGVHCSHFEHIPPESHRAIYASHINYEDLVRARRQMISASVNANSLRDKVFPTEEQASKEDFLQDFLRHSTLSNGRTTAHYHLDDDDHHFNCLTNIRDTVSRVVSCYNFRFLQEYWDMMDMPQVNEMSADDWTVILPQAYDIYSKGCNNEMARTFGSLNDETMINTLTRSSPFFESELHRAAGRMAKCIIVDLDRCEESNTVLRYYLPWLGNELDLCSERKNVGFSKKNRTHIQKGSAEAILKLNEFDEAMFHFGTQLFEYQLRNTNGPNLEGAAST